MKNNAKILKIKAINLKKNEKIKRKSQNCIDKINPNMYNKTIDKRKEQQPNKLGLNKKRREEIPLDIQD